MSQVTIFYPALFTHGLRLPKERMANSKWPDVTVLPRLCSRAKVKAVDKQASMEDVLFNLLSADSDKIKTPPTASLRARALGYKPAGYIACLDLVYLNIDHNSAVPLLHHELNLPDTLAQKIVDELNSSFDDMMFKLYRGQQLLVESQQPFDDNCLPLSHCIGTNVADQNISRPLRKLLSEIEMLLHSIISTHNMQATETCDINSAWIWGQSEYSEQHRFSDDIEVYTDDAYACDIAMLAGADTCFEIQDYKPADKSALIVIYGNYREIQAGNDFYWIQQLVQLDKTVFSSIYNGINSGCVDELRLVTAKHEFTINKKLLGRWWKRIHSMPSLTKKYNQA